ncbi:hypothetical protein CEXT_159201 [Caerostris extrusa]|uniref:Uncharacterized protein n=1 Tax=Caerostris extrusa TaxID=172846 RepID=A0AAV4SM07_CAEEX|nr:hypothetical protein CEXT_159201 [Caerostris extrusa]
MGNAHLQKRWGGKLAKMKNHTLQWLPQELGKLEIPTEQLENRSKKIENNTVIVYLIPAYGGVNSLCPNVTAILAYIILKCGDYLIIQSVEQWQYLCLYSVIVYEFPSRPSKNSPFHLRSAKS